MNILLTGGVGYIGSHNYVALLEAGYQPVILDHFANSHPELLKRLERITGQPVLCERGDVRDRPFVEAVLSRGLDRMMRDTWRWQSGNPDGYR